ncbi:sulfotransferase family 2 domain-containing protein [Pacificoceanicola onchidii]|uniref:sulfotransferase family 2 domain-containing protein n=1 Tax=Pacificoceanicola onchidii TaxID=2562685 RepID=UPI0010A6B441|nr:sulfotransferase family 2 domain-containing protein [Pacificoceanicola onchidii]
MPIIRISGKLVYFAHVPRAAGTSVERYLRARFGPLAFADPGYLSVPEGARWTRSSPQHVTRDALDRLFPAGFFDASFAIVRNPYDRLHSVFLRQRDIEQTIPADMSFADWVGSLPQPRFALDNHTRPMLDFIPKGARIFRLEDGLGQVVDWLDDLAGNSRGPREIGVSNSHAERLAFLGRETDTQIPQTDESLRRAIIDRYAADVYWCGYTPRKERPSMTNEQPTRTVILHYHLFKNAGTSLDEILKRNFQERWVTREFSMAGGDNSAELAKWIESEPEAVAFSTHTGIGPVPEVPGVRILTVMILRDPIARIRSAYRFERNQKADTFGARLAKETDLEGYVRTRLKNPADRQCRDFQCSRLAPMIPGEAPELDRAIAAARDLDALGNVADFDGFLARLAEVLKEPFPEFTWESVQANVSKPAKKAEANSEEVTALLEKANQNDLKLVDVLFPEKPAPAD